MPLRGERVPAEPLSVIDHEETPAEPGLDRVSTQAAVSPHQKIDGPPGSEASARDGAMFRWAAAPRGGSLRPCNPTHFACFGCSGMVWYRVLVGVSSTTKNWRYCLVILLAAARVGSAQLFSFGAKAGVPITNFLEGPVNAYTSYTYKPSVNPYIIGATAEVHLPFGFGIEIDALYRHFGYSGGPYTADKTTTGDWEFPGLVKYRFPGKALRPFADAGLAVDTLTGSTQTYVLVRIDNMFFSNTLSDPLEMQKRTIVGFVAGAGLDLHTWHMHFLPELRYTRWKDQHFLNSVPTVLSSNQNQVEFLLGITF